LRFDFFSLSDGAVVSITIFWEKYPSSGVEWMK
jgi:hypothetical protein